MLRWGEISLLSPWAFIDEWKRLNDCWRWSHCVGTLCHHAVMEANLWSVFCCVFQLGDPGGLHHHTPSACCQGETVYREHRGAGTGGQRTGQGNASVCFIFTNTEILWSQHSHGNTVIRTLMSHKWTPNIEIYTWSVSPAFFVSKILILGSVEVVLTVWHSDFNSTAPALECDSDITFLQVKHEIEVAKMRKSFAHTKNAAVVPLNFYFYLSIFAQLEEWTTLPIVILSHLYTVLLS